MKVYQAMLALALAFLLTFSSMPMPIKAATTYGPRIDELLVNIYPNAGQESAAFENRVLDLVDYPLTSTEIARWQVPPYSDYIALDPFSEVSGGMLAHSKAWRALNVEYYGVRNWWNLECMHNPEIGPTGGQLRWGFSNDIDSLNVIYSTNNTDWRILDKIYDTLITFNPLNRAVDMPWMASSWTGGTWNNPRTGLPATKVSFSLRQDIKWISPVTGLVVGDVTPEDVRFTFQYVLNNSGTNYFRAAGIERGFPELGEDPNRLRIFVSGNKIEFYMIAYNPIALRDLGGMPILPKFIFETIAGSPTGFTPGNLPAGQVLVGSGPFYYVAYTAGVICLLRANRNYYMPIVPNVDTDPTYIKLDWGIFKSNVKTGDWTVNVLDLIIVAGSLGWVGLPGDIPQDINKDGKVNVLDLIIVATNIGAYWV